MTDRFDIVRSLVRAAADRAIDRVKGTRVASATLQLFERLTQQRWRLSDETLTAAAAHAEGVDSAMVACHSGRMFVDASMTNGSEVQFSLAPRTVRFAPRGAKEISFDVEPPDAHDTSIVGALAGCIAKATWPMIAPPEVAATASMGTRASSNAWRTPTWATTFATPPESANPTRGRISAATGASLPGPHRSRPP